MAYNFPDSPTLNQVFQDYKWDGEKWILTFGGIAVPPVTPPSFVNAATYASTTANNVTATLPGSRVNGNLLLAYVRMAGPGSGTWVAPSPWTICNSVNQGSGFRPSIIAYRYVDGSETAPNFTCGTVQSQEAQIFQFTGVKASSPIGNVAADFQAGATSFLTCPAITAAAANSLAVNICSSNSPPAGWTARTTGSSVGLADQTLATVGASSGAINTSAVTGNFSNFIMELKS